MKPQTLKIYQADPETGEMKLRKKAQLQITADNIDEAMDKARKLAQEKGLPRIRSINAAPDNTLLIYCEAPVQTVLDVSGPEARRPAKALAREEG